MMDEFDAESSEHDGQPMQPLNHLLDLNRVRPVRSVSPRDYEGLNTCLAWHFCSHLARERRPRIEEIHGRVYGPQCAICPAVYATAEDCFTHSIEHGRFEDAEFWAAIAAHRIKKEEA